MQGLTYTIHCRDLWRLDPNYIYCATIAFSSRTMRQSEFCRENDATNSCKSNMKMRKCSGLSSRPVRWWPIRANSVQLGLQGTDGKHLQGKVHGKHLAQRHDPALTSTGEISDFNTFCLNVDYLSLHQSISQLQSKDLIMKKLPIQVS